MQIVGKNLPGVEITLTTAEARELVHVLKLHKISLESGKLGSGASIDDQIEFCVALVKNIEKRLPVNSILEIS